MILAVALVSFAACKKDDDKSEEKDALTYGGVTYKTVTMKDGKVWMAENLRYLPEGMTASTDLSNVTAGVFAPIKVNAENTGVEFSTDAAVIESNGYLYQAEVALGLKVGDIKSEQEARALEGAQGICPKGWHVPTLEDIQGLIGKVAQLETNAEAPYYNGADGSIEMLNADGFGMDAFGMVTIANVTTQTGTLTGRLAAYPDKLSSGFFCGSSFGTITYNTASDPESGIKNLQFYGFQPMTNKATPAEYTCNGAKVSYRIAAPLRCVKNSK